MKPFTAYVTDSTMRKLDVRVVHASAAEKTMAALSYVMNALWEQDAERDAGVGLTYCGRCEEEGGSSDRHAHWSDVPHSKDCLYAAAAEGMGPATAERLQEPGAESNG